MKQPGKTLLLTLAFCLGVTTLDFGLLVVIVPRSFGQPSAWGAAVIVCALLFWAAQAGHIDAPFLRKPRTGVREHVTKRAVRPNGRRLCPRQIHLSTHSPLAYDFELVESQQEDCPTLTHLQALLPPGATLSLVSCPGAPSGSQCFDVYLDPAPGAKLVYLNPLLAPLFPTCQLDGATRVLVPDEFVHGGALLAQALAVRVWGEQAETRYPFHLEY